MSIGSSWTTAGTVGVGLVGIAVALDVSTAMTAGAVVSGAYLVDKLSALSETTVLTAQLVGANVYEHIKRQVWTPSSRADRRPLSERRLWAQPDATPRSLSSLNECVSNTISITTRSPAQS